jgi:hypothetical protein
MDGTFALTVFSGTDGWTPPIHPYQKKINAPQARLLNGPAMNGTDMTLQNNQQQICLLRGKPLVRNC